MAKSLFGGLKGPTAKPAPKGPVKPETQAVKKKS